MTLDPTNAPHQDVLTGPPTGLPDGPPPPLADELTGPAPTLQDAVLSGSPTPADDAPEVDAPPMTPEQIIGLVAEVSAFGLPPKIAEAYKDDYRNNPMVNLGVQMSGLADALAAYGLTSGGGKLPEWLSVALGISVLGYGVFTTRNKYVSQLEVPRVPEEGPDAGFGAAGVSTPLQATNLGFSHAGFQGGDSVAAP